MADAKPPDLKDVDVLVVEDQDAVARVLRRVLRPTAARVTHAPTFAIAQAALRGGWHWGVILLDQKLPDGDALALLDEIEAFHDPEHAPAIVATSGNLNESSRSLQLQQHGVVLLPKPFTGAEVLAAIDKAMAVRRVERIASSLPPPPMETMLALTHGPIKLDLVRQTVHVDDVEVELQPTQFRLLATLMTNIGHAIGTAELVRSVLRGTHQSGGVNIRFQIHALRRRLRHAGSLIATTAEGYGIGVRHAERHSGDDDEHD